MKSLWDVIQGLSYWFLEFEKVGQNGKSVSSKENNRA